MIDGFVAVDIETTGYHRVYSDIIEIGAVKVLRKKGTHNEFYVEGEFSELIRTWQILPDSIVAVTGITNAMLEGKRSSKEVLEDFLDFVGELPLVVQNAAFDIPFLQKRATRRLGKKFDNDYYDTLTMARGLLPQLENHRLNTLARHYGIINAQHHRALNDARVAADIFLCMMRATPICTSRKASAADTFMNLSGLDL